MKKLLFLLLIIGCGCTRIYICECPEPIETIVYKEYPAPYHFWKWEPPLDHEYFKGFEYDPYYKAWHGSIPANESVLFPIGRPRYLINYNGDTIKWMP